MTATAPFIEVLSLMGGAMYHRTLTPDSTMKFLIFKTIGLQAGIKYRRMVT
jgi:hypothetical protein